MAFSQSPRKCKSAWGGSSYPSLLPRVREGCQAGTAVASRRGTLSPAHRFVSGQLPQRLRVLYGMRQIIALCHPEHIRRGPPDIRNDKCYSPAEREPTRNPHHVLTEAAFVIESGFRRPTPATARREGSQDDGLDTGWKGSGRPTPIHTIAVGSSVRSFSAGCPVRGYWCALFNDKTVPLVRLGGG